MNALKYSLLLRYSAALVAVSLVGFGCANKAWAEGGSTVPLKVECVFGAAQLQGIPPQIVLGLLKTEGGHVGSEVQNTDGSYDLGPIQVNSKVWVPLIARMHFGGNDRAAWAALRDHGCYNVYIGAWIFRQALDEAKGNYAEAVGFYNSHTPIYKRRYQERFTKNFMSLFGNMLAKNGD